jgi:hypothetical protein
MIVIDQSHGDHDGDECPGHQQRPIEADAPEGEHEADAGGCLHQGIPHSDGFSTVAATAAKDKPA